MKAGPSGSLTSVENQTYGYDSLGRMTARADVILSTSETFAYDGLNRLTSTVLNAAGVPGGTQTSNFGYNAIGNITSKTGVGTYAYTSGRPHAVSGVTGTVNGVTNPVYTYDANGNMQTDGTRAFTWTSFNMPLVISKTATGSSPGSGSGTFTYGAEHQRVKQVWTSGGQTTTTYYLGEFDFEKVVDSTGSTYKHYIKAGDRIVASVTRAPSTTTVIYILPDHLNSTSVVTDTSGTATFRMPYDPWGDRRSGAPGSVGASDPTNTIQPTMINRGFTGHEMLDLGNLGLIHMNGRVYDPTLARFVSADPQVQAPYSTQSFNRYAYVWNAPLGSTDPTGYDTVEIWGHRDYGSIVDAFSRYGKALSGSAGIQWTLNAAYQVGQNRGVQFVITRAGPVVGAGAAGVVIGTWAIRTDTGQAAELWVLDAIQDTDSQSGLDGGSGGSTAASGSKAPASAASAPTSGADDKDKNAEPASEKTAKDIAKRIERDLGKDARRDFHDAKEPGAGDRTKEQLKQDARDLYIEKGKAIPNWLK